MATPHGSNSYISVDAQDLSAWVDSVTVGRAQDTAQTTAFGDDDHTFIAGLKSGTFSLGGHWDATTQDGTLTGTFDGSSVEIIYGPEGNTAGQVSYTANCLVTDYSVSSPVADKVSWTASFQRTGALTDGTF
jgi:hypothetical protein